MRKGSTDLHHHTDAAALHLGSWACMQCIHTVQTACSMVLLAHHLCALVLSRQAAAQPSMAVVGHLRPFVLCQCEQDFIQSLVWVLQHCAAMLQ